MDRLQRFFLGTGTGDRGRLLADGLRQDDAWLEHTHDSSMLKSLSVLGLPDEARALHAVLIGLRGEPDCGIGAAAWRYWDEALGQPPRSGR